MDDNKGKSGSSLGKGYSFSPGGLRPKAPPPEPPKSGEVELPEHDSLDEINPDSVAGDLPDTNGNRPSVGNDGNREERVVCSFPGVMKILVPEKSFNPIAMAVRVANMSSGGALVEIHDRAREDKSLNLPDRFFELKIAHPEIPLLRGTVAWTDLSGEKPILGLSFFERNEILASHTIISDTHRNLAGPPPLPELKVDPFPPVCSEETILLTGEAMEAREVFVENEGKRQVVRVENNRFEITLELSPDKKNCFTVQSINGLRKSRQVPIQILFERKGRKGKFVYNVSESTDKEGRNLLTLKFSASLRQAERMIHRFSEVYSVGDRMELEATVTATDPFDRRLVDALHAEGAVLSADTTRNEVAAKLLDELLF